jgi:hypothetical protein
MIEVDGSNGILQFVAVATQLPGLGCIDKKERAGS